MLKSNTVTESFHYTIFVFIGKPSRTWTEENHSKAITSRDAFLWISAAGICQSGENAQRQFLPHLHYSLPVEAPCILALAELPSSLAFATGASLRLGAYYTLRCIA